MTIMPKNMLALAGLPNTLSPLRPQYEEWLRLTAERTPLAEQIDAAENEMMKEGWGIASAVALVVRSKREGNWPSPLAEAARTMAAAFEAEWERRGIKSLMDRQDTRDAAAKSLAKTISAAPVECIESLAIKLDVLLEVGLVSLPEIEGELQNSPIIGLVRSLAAFLPNFRFEALRRGSKIPAELLTAPPNGVAWLPCVPSRLLPEYEEWCALKRKFQELNDELEAARDRMFDDGWQFPDEWAEDERENRDQVLPEQQAVVAGLEAAFDAFHATWDAERERRGLAALEGRLRDLEGTINALANMMTEAPITTIEDMVLAFDVRLAACPGVLFGRGGQSETIAVMAVARMLRELAPDFSCYCELSEATA